MNAKKKEKTRRETTAIKVWVTPARESCDHRQGRRLLVERLNLLA
jgi:hypothetical protein